MLENYITEVRNFLNDQQGQFFNQQTLVNYINRSRRRVASVSGCIRVVPEQMLTGANQEIYPFAGWNALVQNLIPGAQSVLACRSLAVAIGVGGWKPMWKRLPWTDFQARLRIYNKAFVGIFSEPGYYSQYGLGPVGSLYLWPIPTIATPMEVDLTCIPAPLLTDNDPEPIPYPWTDAVAYWAAVMCLLQQQRREDAAAMAELFNTELPQCASVVCPQMIANVYGATLRSA